jgi:hypothetical protein
VGGDRRGPLAAFVVIAIVTAVLLVTSVRSQAAPGWLDPDELPATVVAARVAEPHLWGSVAAGVHQVVQDGVVLVRRAASAASDAPDSTTVTLGPSSSVAGSTETGDSADSADPRVAGTHRHRVATDRHRRLAAPHRARPTRDDPPAPDPDPGSIPARHDHGRHLGWEHGHGRHVGWVRGHGHGSDHEHS